MAKALTDEKDRLGREKAELKQLESVRGELSSSFAAPVVNAPSAPKGQGFGGNRDGGELNDQLNGGRLRLDAPAEEAAARDGDNAYYRQTNEKSVVTAGVLNGLAMDKRLQPRREVRGEGRWLPSIITGVDGKAVATIKMPETTTAWRLTAHGCTVEALVGQATAATLTRKDFFVELKTPSFLREGDEIRVVGRVHNLTDFAGNVPLTLHVLDAKDHSKVLATREKSVEVKAKGGAEVAFDSFVIPNLLNVVFELTGAAGEQKDSLEQTLPVQPWGLPYAAHAGGTANTDTAAVLRLPDGRKYTSTWMTVSVGPDVKNAVLDMALQNYGPLYDYARIMPPVWGEHPANELIAAASALSYANSGKADQVYSSRLAERARALVAALVSTQGTDGSWNSEALGIYSTARVFWALVTARNAGIAVN